MLLFTARHGQANSDFVHPCYHLTLVGPPTKGRGQKVQRAGSEPHLLMAEAEGLFAPVSVQFKDANQVSNGSDDGQAKDRLDSGS